MNDGIPIFFVPPDISSSSGSNNSDTIEQTYYPNIIIADDQPMLLKSLAGQLKYIKGPDQLPQICDTAIDGDDPI